VNVAPAAHPDTATLSPKNDQSGDGMQHVLELSMRTQFECSPTDKPITVARANCAAALSCNGHASMHRTIG
jgi:hypothetical protein